MFDSLLNFFSSLPDNTHDDIYPIHFIGQTRIIRDTINNYVLRYDTVLDADKLHDSLTSLINTGEWRKLGGRLRRNKNRELEIRVPREFTPARPAIRFSRANFDVEIDLHPTTCRLPRTTGDIPSLHDDYGAFRGITLPEDHPQTIEDYLKTDEPLIRLHVVSFVDGTLVSLILPHSLTDIMGFSGLLRAWSDVLAGHQAQALLGTREDVLNGVGMPSDELAQAPHVLEGIQIKGFSLVVLAARLLWDLLVRKNVYGRTIYLPATFISRLRQSAKEEGALDHVPFLSDGDLITAWGSRMILTSRGSGPAMIYSVFDLRDRLSAFTSTSGTYVQNLIAPMTVYLPHVGPSLPSIGYLAQRIRQCITEQATDTQFRRLVRLLRKSITSTGLMSLFGGRNAMVTGWTNWSRARLGEAADFSPAVVSTPSRHAHDVAGLPVLYWGIASVDGKFRDAFVVLGKDREGNYWLQAHLRDETWKYIQSEFNAYQ